jgi:hypothetical protein
MAPHRDDDDDAWGDDPDDGWDDDLDDEVGSSDDSGDEPTVPCPYCGRQILEDSPRCPHCERYISAEDSPPPRKPLWVVATALICLGIVLWWLSSSL